MRPPRDTISKPHVHLCKIWFFCVIRIHWGENFYGYWIRATDTGVINKAIYELNEFKLWREKVLRGF